MRGQCSATFWGFVSVESGTSRCPFPEEVTKARRTRTCPRSQSEQRQWNWALPAGDSTGGWPVSSQFGLESLCPGPRHAAQPKPGLEPDGCPASRHSPISTEVRHGLLWPMNVTEMTCVTSERSFTHGSECGSPCTLPPGPGVTEPLFRGSLLGLALYPQWGGGLQVKAPRPPHGAG